MWKGWSRRLDDGSRQAPGEVTGDDILWGPANSRHKDDDIHVGRDVWPIPDASARSASLLCGFVVVLDIADSAARLLHLSWRSIATPPR
jgi:hypothetical protein